jgi:threonine dehydratase
MHGTFMMYTSTLDSTQPSSYTLRYCCISPKCCAHMTVSHDVDFLSIRAAAVSVAGIAVHSPLVPAVKLSARLGHPTWLKLETLQPTGAFKIRGAANALSRLSPEQRGKGVVCCSTGNHGRAVAYAAQRLGIAATVCLSHLVPETKLRAIEDLGARVRRVGRSQDEAQRETDRLVMEEGLIDIPPFDHPRVIAGQGTLGLEILDERPEIETILVPLSGGGLISGIAIAAKAIKPSIRIIGVSMERGAAMHASLAAGRPVDVEEVTSLADSLGGGIGLNNRWTFDICRRLVDDVILLTEEEIYRAMRALLMDDGLIAEGGGAVGVAALLAGKVKLSGPAALVISGRNVDISQLLAIGRGEPVQLGSLMVQG